MQSKDGYARLLVYEKAYKAALAIYRLTETFPKEERKGIGDQMRRASISIPLNIAEGYAKRESQQEFRRFLKMAIGSANEMSVLIEFAKDLSYIDEEKRERASGEYEEIGKMLNGLIKKLSEKPMPK